MYTIEFEADVENGVIKIPDQYAELNAKHIKVIALVDALKPVKPNDEETSLSDTYLDTHWRELIITKSIYPRQDDDRLLKEEYGNYLSVKNSA